MENLEDSESRAPGADDNASGVAVILEIARLVSKLRFEKSIQLVFFSGRNKDCGDQNTTLNILKTIR